MDQKYTAFMFCRGGSKGIPGKNIIPVADKPLLAHTIECALSSQYIERILVSTDDDEIATVAAKYGAGLIKRPQELARDESPELLAWRHAIETTELERPLAGDRFISLPATSPLRAPQDIDAALERFAKNDCDIVFGISPSARSPYLNMVKIDQNDHLEVISPSSAFRRQDTPDVYDITTAVYVSSTDYIANCTSLMAGKVGYVIIPPERALDIDEPFDLHLAEILIKNPFTPSAPFDAERLDRDHNTEPGEPTS
jgi:N-acylneuraminate cytidylyltransferase